MTPSLRTGLSRILDGEGPDLGGSRAALLTHPAAVLPDLTEAAQALARSRLVDLTLLLGPEHGVRGSAAAGATEDATHDELTGLPTLETYGLSVEAVAERLTKAGVEVVLVDLQDVGCRCYTYPSTLRDVLLAAREAQCRTVVLDRPNPLGGAVAAGPNLEPAFSSFVGVAPTPLRHGLTIGELARLLVPGADPEVVAMEGWRREDYWTCPLWVPPSPNLPTVEAVRCYAGTVLIEGTNLSEGRGTTTPFTFVGAPWADGRLATHLRQLQLPGLLVRDASVTPTAGKHAGARSRGVALHVSDPAAFNPVTAAVAVIAEARRLYPEEFRWAGAPDEAGRWFIDKLSGSSLLRTAVDAGAAAAELATGFSEVGRPGPAPLLYS